MEHNIRGDSKQLMGLRPALATAAQKVYDGWDQSSEEGDPELGFGGICQDVADAMADVLSQKGIESQIADSHGMGDQHVWVVAQVKDGIFNVDIHPSVYESGSGYTWNKKPDVHISANHVNISLLDDNPSNYSEYTDVTGHLKKSSLCSYLKAIANSLK